MAIGRMASCCSELNLKDRRVEGKGQTWTKVRERRAPLEEIVNCGNVIWIHNEEFSFQNLRKKSYIKSPRCLKLVTYDSITLWEKSRGNGDARRNWPTEMEPASLKSNW